MTTEHADEIDLATLRINEIAQVFRVTFRAAALRCVGLNLISREVWDAIQQRAREEREMDEPAADDKEAQIARIMATIAELSDEDIMQASRITAVIVCTALQGRQGRTHDKLRRAVSKDAAKVLAYATGVCP